ncbi:S1C family serine protease [Petroclostridium xylanilyticum]|uniref:S1C family serine protease n=1 Tax=Petroclostridium xylanilyticum TaxID=1792311 RepID=UPI000B989A8B|nr:trypsin-like peptidase domain-containing protein [Petroclostridium xylanilyticum]
MYSQKNGGGLWRGLLIALTSSLLTGLLLMLFIPSYIDRNYNPENINNKSIGLQIPQAQNIAQTQPARKITQPPNAEILDITAIASRVMPSVVGISTSSIDQDSLFRSSQGESWSVGSGVIVSENGYILTNHHVVGPNPNRIVVTLANGKTINARSEWADPTLDLAIIKVNATGLPVAVLGDADQLKVGETAVAIGNPLGLQFQRTVTAGIISAVNRTIRVATDGRENFMEGLIQTDASINPGNSGGPLINSRGEVIGINTIKVASAEGMGFAIPINITKPVITSFLEKGSYSTPYMGLFAYDRVVAEYVNQEMNIQKGVYVAQIDVNSPVYRAGIRSGDIITHMDDVEVNTMMQLREAMFKCGPGSNCTLRFIRDGRVREVSFTLENRTNDGLITR